MPALERDQAQLRIPVQHAAAPMSAAMLRWAFHTWLVERCKKMLSHVSQIPGG